MQIFLGAKMRPVPIQVSAAGQLQRIINVRGETHSLFLVPDQVGFTRLDPCLVLRLERLWHSLDFHFHLGDLGRRSHGTGMSGAPWLRNNFVQERTISSASSSSISTRRSVAFRCSTGERTSCVSRAPTGSAAGNNKRMTDLLSGP